METAPDRNVFQRIMSRIREDREGESDLSASEMPASMDTKELAAKPRSGVKMPMAAAKPAGVKPAGVAPGPVMAAVDQATPQMGAGRLSSDLRPEVTTPAAPAATPKGPGTAPSMSEPQQWGGKGGYFYDYKPSKVTKGTPGYRPARITMHGGRYNNTAGTTIDENHTHFKSIIEELDALGDNKRPFTNLAAYQREQSAGGNPTTNTEDALQAAADELIPEQEVRGTLGPGETADLTPMQEQDLSSLPPPPDQLPTEAEPAPPLATEPLIRGPMPGAGVSFDAGETPESPTDLQRFQARNTGRGPLPNVSGRDMERQVSDALAGLTSVGSGVSRPEVRRTAEVTQEQRREQDLALRALSERPEIKDLHIESLTALQNGDLEGAFEAASRAMRMSPEVAPIMLPILRVTQR